MSLTLTMTALPLRKRQERKTKRCPARGWRGRGSLSLSFSSIFMLTNCRLLFESENVALCRRHSQGSSVLSVLLSFVLHVIFRNPALLLLLRRIHFREWKERQRGTCFVVTVSAAAFFARHKKHSLKGSERRSPYGENVSILFSRQVPALFFWRGDHSATENRQC